MFNVVVPIGISDLRHLTKRTHRLTWCYSLCVCSLADRIYNLLFLLHWTRFTRLGSYPQQSMNQVEECVWLTVSVINILVLQQHKTRREKLMVVAIFLRSVLLHIFERAIRQKNGQQKCKISSRFMSLEFAGVKSRAQCMFSMDLVWVNSIQYSLV